MNRQGVIFRIRWRWDLFKWYSARNAVPVIGWIGGSGLHHFRITIGYPNHIMYRLQQSRSDVDDLHRVDITLWARSGQDIIAAIATKNGRPTVKTFNRATNCSA
ncbi:MAG TPA: hypothetical protein VGF82_23035 [Terracidiphilus sp.]